MTQIQLERLGVEAREIHLGRTLLTAIAFVLYGIGWIASKATLSLAWACVAVRLGWREARAASPSRRETS